MKSIIQVSQEINVVVNGPPEVFRFPMAPGDFVCVDPDFIVVGDIPLLIPLSELTIGETLECERVTGHSANEVTGWIRKGQIALVVAVVGDNAFLWGRDHGYGWIDRQAVCRIQDV